MKPRIHEFKKRIRAIKVVISALVAKEKGCHEFTN